MNIETSMWILLCDASAQCEICCRESCLRCSHRGASPAQMWVSPRKVLSNRSIFSGFPPLPPAFFFNKQYVRGNTESPEIGVEVRNISFKFSLTSTSAASLRRALRRGARLRPPQPARGAPALGETMRSPEHHLGALGHAGTLDVLDGLLRG